MLLVDRHDIIRDANPHAIELVGEPVIGESWSSVERRSLNLRYESAEGDKRRHVSVSATFGELWREADSDYRYHCTPRISAARKSETAIDGDG